mmetsp:Transcript_59803/g.121995  ORF Transcript_59803/g.121995 Transcript_59803/m.121995 type:complete len:114 (-) Transcript_59803:445-786(-)
MKDAVAHTPSDAKQHGSPVWQEGIFWSRGQSPHKFGGSRSGCTHDAFTDEMKDAVAHISSAANWDGDFPGILPLRGQSPHSIGSSRSGCTQAAFTDEMKAAVAHNRGSPVKSG